MGASTLGVDNTGSAHFQAHLVLQLALRVQQAHHMAAGPQWPLGLPTGGHGFAIDLPAQFARLGLRAF